MRHDELVSTFGETVGVEKAQSLVADALEALDIERKDVYSSHEIADICETISRTSEGYLTVVANEIRVREKANRRFDALLEGITDPVVTVSFEESSPVVKAVNPAFEETFGYGAEVIGRQLPELIVPEEADGETVDEWFRSDTDGGTEIERVTADGERRTFLFRPVVVAGFNGGIEGFGIYTDITERKRRERRLERQNEQLERFVSVVSHDLRNPLSVAHGNARLARELASEPDVEERLDRLMAAHERMETLIEDLLTLASQGRTVDDPAPVRLLEVVETAWGSVETANAKLVVEHAENLTIEADDGRLRQLFENLFRNAIEHGTSDGMATGTNAGSATDRERNDDAGAGSDKRERDGDAATVSERSLVRGADDPDVTIRIGWTDGTVFVEDDGPGIPPAERDSVFDHGYTTSSEGTGFGLAIVEAIADAHGWDVDITEGRTGGARFRLHGVTGWEDS